MRTTLVYLLSFVLLALCAQSSLLPSSSPPSQPRRSRIPRRQSLNRRSPGDTLPYTALKDAELEMAHLLPTGVHERSDWNWHAAAPPYPAFQDAEHETAHLLPTGVHERSDWRWYTADQHTEHEAAHLFPTFDQESPDWKRRVAKKLSTPVNKKVDWRRRIVIGISGLGVVMSGGWNYIAYQSFTANRAKWYKEKERLEAERKKPPPRIGDVFCTVETYTTQEQVEQRKPTITKMPCFRLANPNDGYAPQAEAPYAGPDGYVPPSQAAHAGPDGFAPPTTAPYDGPQNESTDTGGSQAAVQHGGGRGESQGAPAASPKGAAAGGGLRKRGLGGTKAVEEIEEVEKDVLPKVASHDPSSSKSSSTEWPNWYYSYPNPPAAEERVRLLHGYEASTSTSFQPAEGVRHRGMSKHPDFQRPGPSHADVERFRQSHPNVDYERRRQSHADYYARMHSTYPYPPSRPPRPPRAPMNPLQAQLSPEEYEHLVELYRVLRRYPDVDRLRQIHADYYASLHDPARPRPPMDPERDGDKEKEKEEKKIKTEDITLGLTVLNTIGTIPSFLMTIANAYWYRGNPKVD